MRDSTLVLTTLLVVSVMFSVYTWRDLQRHRGALADAGVEEADSRAAHVFGEADTAPASGTGDDLAQGACRAESPQQVDPTEHFMAEAQAIVTRLPPIVSGVPPVHELLRDAEYRAAQKTMIRILEEETNPGLVEALGLGEAEAAKLFEEMAENQLKAVEDLSAHGDKSNMQAVVDSMQRHSANQEEAVRHLLGDSRYSQLQDYRRNIRPALRQVAEIRAELATAGQPLTDFQLRGLSAAIQNQQSRVRDRMSAAQVLAESSAAGLDGRQALQQLDDYKRAVRRGVLESAEQYLTPAQLALLR